MSSLFKYFSSFLICFITAIKCLDQAPLANKASSTPIIKHGLDQETREYINDILDYFHAPGLSIAVLNGNETYLDAFGRAILPDTPATPDTLYYIASCTKSFTAASLLYTLDKHIKTHPTGNKWSIDSKLKDILGEDFVLPSDYATQHATPKDALAHRLGLPRCETSYGGEGYVLSDVIRSLRHLPVFKEFRQEWHYLNQGYMIIQAVIQRLSGLWIGAVHREAIWEPLGMDSTVINLTEALEIDRLGKARLSHGYSYNPLTKSLDRQPWTDTELVGGGGIISSAADMAKWVRAFMEGGKGLPLNKGDFDSLTTPLMLKVGADQFEHMSPAVYAMGWQAVHYRGNRLVLHGGAIMGYSSQIAYMPEKQWGIVLLANGDDCGDRAQSTVFLKLMDDFLGVEADDRQDLIEEHDRSSEAEFENWKNAKDRFFADIPSPPTPRSLPLEAYTGRYWNDGFREIELRLEAPREFTLVDNGTDTVLRADWKRLGNMTIELEWISGEQFLTSISMEVWSPFGSRMPAEFRIGDDGRVTSLGMYLEPALVKDEVMIWFDRTSEAEPVAKVKEL